MAANVARQIEAALGTPVRGLRSLSGGCIGEVYRAALEDGTRVAVKADASPQPRLDVEGYMLRYLAEHSALPVPKVLHAAPGLLVMEFLPGGSHFTNASQAHAAELLAALHAIAPPPIEGRPQFGLDRETLIGPLLQPNPWTPAWVDFFRDARLLHMAEAARREGQLPAATHRRIEAFAARAAEFLPEPPHPTLLHGDVWTTNVLAQGNRITGFIDPAIYYGHPEIELAFSTLFGTFGRPFFERYEALRPLESGFFDTRRDIYNMYPLLVHTRLFGQSYLSGIEATLAKLGF